MYSCTVAIRNDLITGTLINYKLLNFKLTQDRTRQQVVLGPCFYIANAAAKFLCHYKKTGKVFYLHKLKRYQYTRIVTKMHFTESY